jgi:lysozyme
MVAAVAPYVEIATTIIKRHEGLYTKMYKCTAGKNTIGYGHNLDERPISEKAAEQILADDMKDFLAVANKYPWFNALDDVRKAVVVDMVFNLGSLDAFPKLCGCLSKKDWPGAVAEMKNSKWYTQVGVRAVENCSMMLSGNTNCLR